MAQPAVYVYDPETNEWVTPEEYMRRQAEREATRITVRYIVSSLLQGAVIHFTLTGNVCGTTVTLSGTGAVVALGTDVMALIEAFGRPGAAGRPAPVPGPGRGGPGGRRGP
jgi:hypothetical protein